MTATMTLANGRILCFEEFGDPNGKPLFFFHGTPNSRLLRHPDDSLTASLGIRLITIDRPGFGKSTYIPNRQLLDWPDDVVALADKLGIEKFAVAGISGGGPYVAACAYKIPDRLTHAGIISGVGPTDSPDIIEDLYTERKAAVFIARNTPWLLRLSIWLFQNPRRNPEKYFQKILAKCSHTDREILTRAEIKSLLISGWIEGTRYGMKGFAREGIIFSKSWGFQMEDIGMNVHIWHGDQDSSVPITIAKLVAKRIPQCEFHILVGEGHFLLFDHWSEILTTLKN